MQLYLVRHGQYDQTDPNQPLSFVGKDEVRRVAAHIAKLKLQVPQVFHSSKVRAQQTAKILADVVNQGQCEYLAGLEPNDPIQAMITKIQTYSDDIMLVGHLPFMGLLANQLLGAHDDTAIVNFVTCTVVCLTNDDDHWKINWILNPNCIAQS